MAQMDLTEPEIRGDGGYRYICSIYDSSTGFVYCEPLIKKSSAVTVAAHFLSINPHVSTLRVDNAGELTGTSMQSVAQRQGVAIEEVSPGASASNGGVERSHRTIKNKIDLMMQELQFGRRTEYWPWFVKAAQGAINYSYSNSKDGIPAVLRSDVLSQQFGRKYQALPLPPFAYRDVVKFKTPRDKKGSDMDTSGHREGLFLSYVHSGSCEILSVQSERVVRWIVHPSWVQHGDQQRFEAIKQDLLWSLGEAPTRFLTKDYTESDEDNPFHTISSEHSQADAPRMCVDPADYPPEVALPL